MRSPFSPFARVALIAFLAFGLAACPRGGQQGLENAGDSGTEDLTSVISYPIYGADGARLAPEAVDDDSRAVLTALKARLDGADADTVEAALGLATPRDFANAIPDLAQFRIVQVELGGVSLRDDTAVDQEEGRAVTGVAHLRDDLGRRLDLVFGGRSRKTETGREIDRLAAIAMLSTSPLTELFLVPVERADERLLASIDDYATFYRQVEAAALEAGQGARLPAGPAEYFLVVFVKDPLMQNAALAVSLAGVDGRNAPEPGRSYVKVYRGGWVVTGTLANLDLSAGPPLWMNVTFEPEQVKVGPEAGPRLIAAFPVTQAARDLREASAFKSGTN